MSSAIKLTTFLIFLNFLYVCYSSSKPKPDYATVVISFGLEINDQVFSKKVQGFSQKLREAIPRIQFEEGDEIRSPHGRSKLYKAQLTYKLSYQVKTIGSSLGIKVLLIPPNISFVTVQYTFSSDEYYFLQNLKEAGIQVIRSEDWLKTNFIYHSFEEFPRDQEYIVEVSLKSEVDEIAEKEGILKTIREYERPGYATIKFTLGSDKIEFLNTLNEKNIQLKMRRPVNYMLSREYLVDYYDIYRIKDIAKQIGVSDIVYNMTKLSPVYARFDFSSDKYEFEEKLKKANIRFDKDEDDLGWYQKVIEYIVVASLIPNVQEIAKQLNIDLS